MELFVRDHFGATIPVVAKADDAASNIMERIAAVHDAPVEEQRLMYGGRPLADGDCLAACGVAAGATLFLTSTLDGGAKKRKKKTYTKPKKIKHKRKKVKLAVLKFYKVDSNDKVTR